jgi:hypothetical protein
MRSVFASWDAEEYALVGSTEWVEDHVPWLTSTTISKRTPVYELLVRHTLTSYIDLQATSTSTSPSPAPSPAQPPRPNSALSPWKP